MDEISSQTFPSLRAQGTSPFPLIGAVLRGLQPGQVFGNDGESSDAALVVNNFGFMQWLGRESDEVFNRKVEDCFRAGLNIRARYLLWYAPPASWICRINAFRTARPVRFRERMRFRFDSERGIDGVASSEVPEGMTLKHLNQSNVESTATLGLKIGGHFWASIDDFLAQGISVGLFRGERLLSLCYSACVVDGLTEVDILTDEASRGAGLAKIVGREFLRVALARNLQPTWDCFTSNGPSMRLAARLGFVPEMSYDLASFNIPFTT